MRKPLKPNKTAVILLSLLCAFAVLLALYLAVLAPWFSDTEEPPEEPLQTLPGEGIGITGLSAMMFPKIDRTDIRTLRVWNNYQEGAYKTYAFLRDAEDEDGDGDTYDFVIEGFKANPYDETKLSELVVAAGYTTYTTRLDTLKLSEKSEEEVLAAYADFGLAPADHPIYYELETMDGAVYKVYIGDKTPDGSYYARLEGRLSVYVVPSSTGTALHKTIGYYADPTLTFEADSQYAYAYIHNFALFRDDTFENIFFGEGDGTVGDLTSLSPYVMFTYLKKPERDVFHANTVYAMLAPVTSYTPYDGHVDAALQVLPGMAGTEVLKLGLSREDFAAGGLLENVAYTIYYEMPYGITQDKNQDPIVDYWIKNVLFVSPRNTDGTYTVGSLSYREGETVEIFYNMIAKVDGSMLSFVEYSVYDWVEPSMFNASIDSVSGLEFSSARGDYFYEIMGDGTADQTVIEKYSGFRYFYKGRNVAFEVNEQGYCEDIDQFRSLYRLLVELEYQGAIAEDTDLTPEEIAAIMADDSNCLLSLVVTMEDGREMTYRFFPYSERHSMVSLSGDGIEDVTVFYTLTAAVRRIADATWQLANGVYIDINHRY